MRREGENEQSIKGLGLLGALDLLLGLEGLPRGAEELLEALGGQQARVQRLHQRIGVALLHHERQVQVLTRLTDQQDLLYNN